MTAVNQFRIGSTQWGFHHGAPAFTNFSVDATNDGFAFAFQAQNANAITHVGFRVGVRTGTPPTYVATIESIVATTGAPDGTDVGGGSPTAVTFTPPADATWDGTWQWVTLTNAFTPTAGSWYIVTIRYSSGTIDASNFNSFSTDVSNMGVGAAVHGWPYATRLTAGTWAKRVVTPVGGVRTATERYGYIIEDIYVTRTASTVGHRVAMKFRLPGTSTYQVRGIRFTSSLASLAGKNPLCKIWSASSALQSVTLDTDIQAQSTNFASTVLFPSALSTLSGGTDYYAGLEVADAASGGIILYGAQLDSSSDLSSMAGGSTWHMATYDGATWTDDQTVRPWVELILEDITEPAGGGNAYVIGS